MHRNEINLDNLTEAVSTSSSRKFKTAPKEADIDPTRDLDDFDRAEDAIFHAVETAEKAVVHAVEDEVGTYFHDLPKHKKRETSDEERVERKFRVINGNLKTCLEEMVEGSLE